MILIYKKCIRNHIPLTFLNEDEILLSKKNTLYVYSISKDSITKLLALPSTSFKAFAINFKFLSRILRLGVKYALSISKDAIIIAFNRSLYTININTKTYKKTFTLTRGSRPLSITQVENIEGFDDMICFGEYFENFNRQPVHIYKKVGQSWDIAYTFPKNTIEHIHAIVPDKYRNCLWILTGDFNSAAAIWMVKDNFSQVTSILANDQIYRSCVGYSLPEGLLYATDSQFETNSIRLLSQKNGQWLSQHIRDINGPVIYGCEMKDNYFFSTSVEGISHTKNVFLKYFDRKPGPGVKDNNSYIIGGNLKEGFKVLSKNKKDVYPFILFQFGTTTFPSGKNKTNLLFSYNTALKKDNLSTSIFMVKEN